MTNSVIKYIEYYLPKNTLNNLELAEIFPDYPVEKIANKTGIHRRHISGKDEYVSDMAVSAAEKLFLNNECSREEIDYLLVCTQSPDYLLPTTACIIQSRLKLPNTIGALDINLGCSGYVYGLSLAHGLIKSEQAKKVLLITSDTYSKFLNPTDKSVRTIFGDGASATLLVASKQKGFKEFSFGTDGNGANNLICSGSGLRKNIANNKINNNYLYMNGGEIFEFALNVIPDFFNRILHKSNCRISDIDHFIFHQSNRYMLTHLRDKLKIPEEKFLISIKHVGNTVSSSIPIAIKKSISAKRLKKGDLIMLLGFGVGYSWAGTLFNL